MLNALSGLLNDNFCLVHLDDIMSRDRTEAVVGITNFYHILKCIGL